MNQFFEHEGYRGSVNVSVEDKCLHGKIEFIADLVTYEGETVEGLEKEFRAAVDDYLATCTAQRKSPDKPFSGTFNVRVGAELHRKAAMLALGEGVALNDLVKQALELRVRKDNDEVVHRHMHDVVVHYFTEQIDFGRETTPQFTLNRVGENRLEGGVWARGRQN